MLQHTLQHTLQYTLHTLCTTAVCNDRYEGSAAELSRVVEDGAGQAQGEAHGGSGGRAEQGSNSKNKKSPKKVARVYDKVKEMPCIT